MSSKEASRFGAAEGGYQRSWVWRLWVEKNEIYLGAKNVLNTFKVSLHSSGIWRAAFVSELKREDPTSDRLVHRWSKPSEFRPGWTEAVGIIISNIRPKREFSAAKESDERIYWAEVPHDNQKIVFKILISSPFLAEPISSILDKDAKVISELTKKNGEKVWLIECRLPLDVHEKKEIEDTMRGLKIHLKSGSKEDAIPDARAIKFFEGSSSAQPMFLDIPLGKENLEIAP